jgi:hypothetical protein
MERRTAQCATNGHNEEEWDNVSEQEEAKYVQRFDEVPQNIVYYKDSWSLTLRDMYDKPLDWYGQEQEYDRKVSEYEKEKI